MRGRTSDGGAKIEGDSDPPSITLGLPPPLERRKEYYEHVVCFVRLSLLLFNQSIRHILAEAKCGQDKYAQPAKDDGGVDRMSLYVFAEAQDSIRISGWP
jgi:hypothetical protein